MMGDVKICETIDNITKQFLCCVPVKSMQWDNIFEYFTYEMQDIFLTKTVNSELLLKHPIQTSYQKAFLKHVIENLEVQGSEIHDNLYSAYGRLVSLPCNDEHYFKHYHIKKSGNIVSIKENVNLISDGTTGLRTWQASLALSEWILHNDKNLKNKVILELGSGVGLTGLTVAMECSPSFIYFTDCHASVLKSLCENISLNLDKSVDRKPDMIDIIRLKRIQERCLYSNIHSNIFVLDLPWQDIDEKECLKLGTIDKVIAADVVYDVSLFEPLVRAIKSLAAFCDVEEFIFSCTERNKETIEEFVKEICETFTIEELNIPNQENFIWPTDTPIRIFKFNLDKSHAQTG